MAKSDQPKYRYNEEPRISANQLAEYVLASPTRRQSILRNAKFSPTFLVIRYSAAKDAICRYLSHDTRNITSLVNAETEQMQAAEGPGTNFQKNDALLSAEAIRAFRSISFSNKVPYATFTLNNQKIPMLPINGVKVSVRLDLIARHNAKGTVGGAIIQTSKAVASKSWRKEHSKVVGALIWMASNKHLAALGKIDRRLCMSIDVFGNDVVLAPTSYKRILNDVDAACGEISAMWPAISPPPDYDGPE